MLEYIVPFSKNIKGIENSSKAFYQSYIWVEEQLLQAYSWWIWHETTADPFSTEAIDAEHSAIVLGSVIPQPERWNSEYTEDASMSQLSQEKSIQLFIWNDRLVWNDNDHINLEIRIPDLDRDTTYDEAFNTSPVDEIVFWQLSSENDSLSASGSLIDESSIHNNAINSSNPYRFWVAKNWVKLDWDEEDFNIFYDSQCRGSNECVLKISIINPLVSNSNNTTIPYLEYRITTSADIPLPETYISSRWKSYWFSKWLEVVVPRQTTNAAFDFTVFQ